MKKIKFIPSNQQVLQQTAPPVPAKTIVPQWYKDGELWISPSGNKVGSSKDPGKVGGMKTCLPFLDAMISGYLITTWHDVEITKNDGEVDYRYIKLVDGEIVQMPENEIIKMISERTGVIGHTMPRPAGHSKNHMTWIGQWGIRVPRGWSIMMTHPFNRFELPFTTMSGFMDSDGFWSNGNIPFFIKEGWTGVIPKGTPVAQIIPIKRKSWMGNVSLRSVKYSEKLGRMADAERKKSGAGYYKNKIWVKKQYD